MPFLTLQQKAVDTSLATTFRPPRLTRKTLFSPLPSVSVSGVAHRFAYDGRGNCIINGPRQMENAVAALGGYAAGLYAEEWVPFEKELAVMVARSGDGKITCYPVVETVQKEDVCFVTEAPADVPRRVAEEARSVAERAVGCLDGAGVFGCGAMAINAALGPRAVAAAAMYSFRGRAGRTFLWMLFTWVSKDTE